MGTPDFAAVALNALIASPHEVSFVISQPDAQKNRGKKILPTPVKEAALAAGLKVMQPEKLRNDAETIAAIKNAKPDVIVVAAYGQILSKEILEVPRFGCINIHGSILPKYRGAAPIQRAVIDGEEETGVTIMQMGEGLDTGDMLKTARTKVERKTSEELYAELAALGAKLMLEVLTELEEGRAKPVKQDEAKATYANMLFKKDGELDFAKPAVVLERLIRGYTGAYTYLGGEVFKVWAADVLKDIPGSSPGTVIGTGKDGIKVACGEGVLLLKEVQAAGKKRMPAGEYLRGKQIPDGTVFTKAESDNSNGRN
jgi:methionyl-tRNA formyltransferase